MNRGEPHDFKPQAILNDDSVAYNSAFSKFFICLSAEIDFIADDSCHVGNMVGVEVGKYHRLLSGEAFNLAKRLLVRANVVDVCLTIALDKENICGKRFIRGWYKADVFAYRYHKITPHAMIISSQVYHIPAIYAIDDCAGDVPNCVD